MKEDNIVFLWLSVKSNRDMLPIIAYDPPVYDYFVSSCDKVQFGDDVVYKVAGLWQKIISKQ